MSDINKILRFIKSGLYRKEYENKDKAFAYLIRNGKLYFAISGFNYDYVKGLRTFLQEPISFRKDRDAKRFEGFVVKQIGCTSYKWIHLTSKTNTCYTFFNGGNFSNLNKMNLEDFFLNNLHKHPNNVYQRLFSCAEQKLEHFHSSNIYLHISKKPCKNCQQILNGKKFLF